VVAALGRDAAVFAGGVPAPAVAVAETAIVLLELQITNMSFGREPGVTAGSAGRRIGVA
jgi:hypothetical protein